MAKPDSNFVYYITKKGGRNKLWKCIRVKYAPCYVRKGPQLTQKHTRARRRRQHHEWIQCFPWQLIGKKRHVTKFWNVAEVFCFPFRSRSVNVCRVSDSWACNIQLPMWKHGSRCCRGLHKTFPRKDETGWEGRKRYINTGAFDTDTHVTLRVGSIVLSSR